MEGVTVLGSTGSIGKSTLSVIRHNPDRFYIVGLSCQNNIELLSQQIREFSPQVVSVGPEKSDQLVQLIHDLPNKPTILEGVEGQVEVARYEGASKLVAATVGAAGIEAVMIGITTGKTIALANKESLVLAGSLLIEAARKHGVRILPIDSEHNAIFQSLKDEKKEYLEYITLTASGGPFLTKPLSEFKDIKLADALNHPNWEMGNKITIDSATMMNKCLEIIEAKWLFDLRASQIKVLIHPQSIVHSMVTFKDGSTICQMGVPDMKIPIANCLGYPDRIESGSRFLSLAETNPLTFETPDLDKFPTLTLAYDVIRLGGGTSAALNGANEMLVNRYLNNEIHFTQITAILVEIVNELKSLISDTTHKTPHYLKTISSVDDALRADNWGREFVNANLAEIKS